MKIASEGNPYICCNRGEGGTGLYHFLGYLFHDRVPSNGYGFQQFFAFSGFMGIVFCKNTVIGELFWLPDFMSMIFRKFLKIYGCTFEKFLRFNGWRFHDFAPNEAREADIRRLQVTNRLPSYGIISESH